MTEDSNRNPPTEPTSAADIDVHALAQEHPADVAEVIGNLSPEHGAQILAALPPQAAADALEQMDQADAAEMVRDMQPHVVATAVGHMAPDDAADLLAELPDEHREQILDQLTPDDRSQLDSLMAYPPDTAGGIMSPAVIALPENLTIPQAIAQLRHIAEESEQVYYTYVVGANNRLVGVLSLRDLLLARESQHLHDIMIPEVVSVPAPMDREQVAALFSKYGYLALPVVDVNQRLLGIITVDDVVEVIQEEATEDMHRMVGAGADEHIDSPIGLVLRRRVPWLLINLGTAFLASSVVGLFEQTLHQLTALAVLMPIVAGQAGNTGMQSMAVMIRSIATGETRGMALRVVLAREVWIGLGSGIVIALTCAAGCYLWLHDIRLAGILGFAMVLCMLMATVSGALVPWVMKRLGFDPAQSASIILTTITDVSGFGIFLTLGTLLVVAQRHAA